MTQKPFLKYSDNYLKVKSNNNGLNCASVSEIEISFFFTFKCFSCRIMSVELLELFVKCTKHNVQLGHKNTLLLCVLNYILCGNN